MCLSPLSRSQHDVHSFEKHGHVPSVAVVSSAFTTQAIYQAEMLGMVEPERHMVPAEHPISDATDAEIALKADLLFDDLMYQLTNNRPTSAARRNHLRSATPSEACLAGA